ncbi:MAG: PKD domain-containing protein, partial [Thermoplasmata archaeon]
MEIPVVIMLKRAVKIAVCVLAFVMFVAAMVPLGTSTTTLESSGITGILDFGGQKEADFNPSLNCEPEEPDIPIVVEKDTGERFVVEVPKGADQDFLEKTIQEHLKEESIREETPREDIPVEEDEEENMEEPQEEPEEEIDDEQEIDAESLDIKEVALHSSFGWDYQDGYLFCYIDEPLRFDARDLFTVHYVTKYEWDFEGDGHYETESSSPAILHIYRTAGVYNLRIRITYRNNCTYWRGNLRTSYLIYPDNYIGWDPQNQYPTYYSVEQTIEYEMRIGVGDWEKGYPPLLDFEFAARRAEEPQYESPPDDSYSVVLFDEGSVRKTSLEPAVVVAEISPPAVNIQRDPEPSFQVDDITLPAVKLPDFPIIGDPIVIQPGIPWFNTTPVEPGSTEVEEEGPVPPRQVHVRMIRPQEEVIIPHLPDCVVEFDAQST